MEEAQPPGGRDVTTLLVMCLAMFVGAFSAGYIPILLNISPSK